MEVNVNKIRQSLNALREHVQPAALSPANHKVLQQFSQLKSFKAKDVQHLLHWLGENLLDETLTEQIALNFEEFLLLILSKGIESDGKETSENFIKYQRKSIALSKLLRLSVDARKYATTFFASKPAPFECDSDTLDNPPPKKRQKNNQISKDPPNSLDILKCCYQLLNSEPSFYKELWNWSTLVEKYLTASDKDITDMERLYFNHILAILTNMSSKQLQELNINIPPAVLIQFDEEQSSKPLVNDFQLEIEEEPPVVYQFQSEGVTNVEGVLLPIFNKENYDFYSKTDGAHEKIVRVDSTKVNLRSIALGIASAKTICLSGPVGCGKTTLVQYLARKTGRVCPKINEIEKHNLVSKENVGKSNGFNGEIAKMHNEALEESLDELLNINSKDTNGFLRIQLGDQTDSKMLLGQYRCTDVPGEFIWLPGILTQAVMNGYWLLLEDLDSATQDTFTILSSLLENNYLSVPGFRDCVKIQPGFQLFITVRTNKSSTNSSQKALFSLLEKYLYTINILPLSRNELCKVISTNYPKLATVANRIVDVFLTFSSGDHNVADNLRQQETGDKADNTEQFVALPFETVSLVAVPNAGRLVSTRDLIKLCQRSNPMFSVTSTECAYFVFQNAVDVFCSNLPQGKEKTKLIVSIGAKLGIIQSRCETYANDYKPEVKVDNQRIKVGRAELHAKNSGIDQENVNKNLDGEDMDVIAPKRRKVTFDAEKILSKKRTTFSFTRLASCLLERIAVCVSHAEPVLLVGETGVGKTSSVQYLAERTQHKLVVVNMNNQSDVSDLVGGFKPVDLTFVLNPLRYEFEVLFRKTYDVSKNSTFLSKMATCYNQNAFTVIVKMMIKIADSILTKSEEEELPEKISSIIPRWKLLKVKLMKLHSQLAKSINISFAFIPGSLVNCIKNGDWVLLDEINLASAETLECLSTILEPDGSVVLLEKGDFMPVRRHPDFRIFACMNPNTDIGKKDLPVGIRNRFTEFFVDELTTDNDLALLVNDYLQNTGIQKKSVTNIVKLYKKLRQLASLELNDGLGNRPVYSLRTLCRSLRICAKNLCGSIERNLYESFCLSFLTQLDPDSHNIVLLLIKAALLTNEKAVLKQSIPKPGEDYLDFEGYWIQQGPKALQECANYILTESVKANLKDLSRIISIGKLPILLQGPTSAGKTSLIEYVAKRSGNHCLRINNHEHTDLQEYIGTYVADVTGKLNFHEGVLVQAMRHGYWIILDELNLASTEILEALNRVLDDNRELFIPETQTVVKAHPNFMLFATQNPPGLYGGRKTLSRAFKNRFIELHFSEIPRAELETILERRCLIPPSYAKKMVLCMSDLQKNRKTTSKNVFTLRDLFRWGNRYTFADKKLLADQKYDWNQHLVEEGYLVLSAKVRTEIEIEIIEDALYRNFKKRIDLSRLFEAQSENAESSPVTGDIISSIKSYTIRKDIVWTRNMTRMAVLTAKALQFDEPVLLVGPTGCGKTTVCQILASIVGVQLRILNCHMHTEGADFLGGLRPCRQSNESESEKAPKLFEWADGPLINAMQEGSYFMADEISLAEDSVLERLNCILEPERTVLLAEKGGVAVNDAATEDDAIGSEFVIQAKSGFQFLATMNPGGDFGKKELSPALRNRFTEIWCLPSDAKEDLIQIASNCMSKDMDLEYSRKIATYLVEVIFYISKNVEKFKFSIRDILAWANYMIANAKLSFPERAIFGLETIFLDALEMLPHESINQIDDMRSKITKFAINCSADMLGEKFSAEELESKRGQEVICENGQFGLKPFLITTNIRNDFAVSLKSFTFNAPTTKKNLFRLLSALSLQKPILLEGPPGVGKTSTVESLAKAIGFHIVRINLCEHTDLADLFGTDLPAEDNVLNTQGMDESSTSNNTVGSFIWRDGPLLSALKADNTWILLDELNLAPQSVLEGLNAILDHRGEVYIPELNKTFTLNRSTRIFACQNPLKQGGGRKGLPQSFLNRFNKVYLRRLTTEDLMHVVNEKYGNKFEELKYRLALPISNCKALEENLFELSKKKSEILSQSEEEVANPPYFVLDLSERMVKFSEALDHGISQLEFGYKGGPYEINLRDILRWCDFLIDPETGVHFKTSGGEFKTKSEEFHSNFESFLQTLYDTMKLVYIQRMRSTQDQEYIRLIFGRVFNCDAEALNKISEDVSLYWTNEKLYLNDLILDRDVDIEDQQQLRNFTNKDLTPLLLATQREHLHNIMACVKHQKPVLLCGSTDTGKTKLIDALCSLSNQVCNTDNIDDSVTGSFQQIDLNRHLESLSTQVECIFWSYIQTSILEGKDSNVTPKLLHSWYTYSMVGRSYQLDFKATSSISKELILFRKRIQRLEELIERLIRAPNLNESTLHKLQRVENSLDLLQNFTQNAESLNMGGSFEWVDSKIVKALKYGQFIALEHVNLCSSAVLDRLNPVFEPNGNLLISEKGVSTTDTAEVVEKSCNFRAFLTIDPKNGELSRAMRNRCVELSLQKDSYSIDDMRQIIYSHGVHDIVAINCLIWMHQCIKELTEINNYSISHLNQCAFLVTSYKRIGYATSRAIYVSGMEVYVYSANADLMGYGLAYYQNQLRNIVVKHMEVYVQAVESRKTISGNEDLLASLILHSGGLNDLTKVKLQAMPLKLLLQNKDLNEINLYFKDSESLVELLSKNSQNFLRFYIYMLYESSSFADVELRSLFLNKILGNTPELQQLSSHLNACVESYKSGFTGSLHNLPWNQKLFPRIRDYSLRSSNPNMLRLSSALISRLMLQPIPSEKITKIHTLSALDYPRALAKKLLTDKSNNKLILSLVDLLSFLEQLIESKIRSASMDVTNFVTLIVKLSWFNRLMELAQNQLLINKEFNVNLIDKLVLHYEWLCKHLLRFLAKICGQVDYQDFGELLVKISDYIETTKPKLNLLQKLYVKKIMAFQPFYKKEQITHQEISHQLDDILSLIPHYEPFALKKMLRKYQILAQPEARKARSLVNHMENPHWLNANVKSIGAVQNPLKQSLENYVQKTKQNREDSIMDYLDLHVNFEKMKENIDELNRVINSQEDLNEDEKLNDAELGLLPIKEFYLTKALNQKVQSIYDSNAETELNVDFCLELSTLCSDTWQLVNLYTQEDKKVLLEALKDLIFHIQGIEEGDSNSLRELNENLNGSYKEFNSIWRTLLYKSYKRQLNNLAAHQRNTQAYSNEQEEEYKAENLYEGPPLVNSCLNLLFEANGSLKPVPLKDLDTWKSILRQMRQIIWQNALIATNSYNLLENNCKIAQLHGQKLILELELINQTENDKEFLKLFEDLKSQVHKVKEKESQNDHYHQGALIYQDKEYQSALLNALIGAVELSTLICTPLIDPVEKQRLKKDYLAQDIACLTTLTSVYDFSRILLKYKHFGVEIYDEIARQLEALQSRQEKQNQNVALRPVQCLYVKLVRDMKHFLITNCSPGALGKLLSLAQEVWRKFGENLNNAETASALEMCKEASMKLALWLANAKNFIYHVMKPYRGGYEDFLQPILCAVQQFSFGLEGLRTILCQLQNSYIEQEGKLLNLSHNGYVHRVVGNFAEFPNTQVLKASKAQKDLISIVDCSQENLRMLELKLDTLSKHVHITKEFTADALDFLNSTLAEFNQIWQLEEEDLRRRKAEDESLYVHKTKCETEDEDLIELEEIEENFPTHVEDDYGDYLHADSLEQKKTKLPKKKSLQPSLVNDEKAAILAENFMELLEQYSAVCYYSNKNNKSSDNLHSSIDFLNTARSRLQTFAALFTRHKLSLNDWLDEQAYNSLGLAISLQERLLNELPNSNGTKLKKLTQGSGYNFYKDSNIPEILVCTELLERINFLVKIQLDLYPEHATLLDIQQIISRILKLPSNAALVRFSTGFQLLRQKVAQWNEVAHKNNHLRNEEIELAEYVQKWMRLELQCWRNSLNQTQYQIETRAYRYWFYIYNLLHEFLENEALDRSYTDIKFAEKRFGEGEVLDTTDTGEKSKVAVMDVIKILEQFIQAASYGDFHIRLRLLRSFELYLQCGVDAPEDSLNMLIAGLHNLQVYFIQFSQEIADTKQSMRTPIEKKLKEFVKIESYNKDLSYFSMRNNVARVHRNLNKFLKEYRQRLEEKIIPIFQPQDATVKDYNFENIQGKNLRYDLKVKYGVQVEIKYFVAPEKLRSLAPAPVDDVIESSDSNNLLVKVGKHFSTSRNVVKMTLQQIPYPKSIAALDELLNSQLERCEYLRGLNVDRTKERPKQVLEAKQILQQKRKGLSDFFKVLGQIGISYKSGLLEQSLQTDFVDYELPPFCVRTMICLNAPKEKQAIYGNMAQLYENVDRYYAKSVFKLKLLQNIMLRPLSEIGPPNIERIKGFAVGLFLLVQNQRSLLAQTTLQSYELRQYLRQLRGISSLVTEENSLTIEQLNFARHAEIHDALKASICHMRYVLEQFTLLLDCIPSQSTNELQVLTGSACVILKDSNQYALLTKTCNKALELARKFLDDMPQEDVDLLSYSQLQNLKKQHEDLLSLVRQMRDLCQVPNKTEFLPLGKPLVELVDFAENQKSKTDDLPQLKDKNLEEKDSNVFENLNTEMSNIVHAVLISLQKLYKEHSKPEPEIDKSSPKEKDNPEDDLELKDNHLKALHSSLEADWNNLSVSSMLSKLSLILLNLKLLPGSVEKLSFMRKLSTILPLLEQCYLMIEYQLLQQLGSHKVSAKMLSIMLTVFVEIGTKGFCVPPDLMQDEQGEKKQDQKEGEGFGLEDGTGEKDASDKIESEDQLDDAKRPEDRKDDKNDEDKQDDCKEEKGIEMSDDFEGKMQDIEKPENEEDDSGKSEDEDDLNKEMGETEEGAEKLDEQIWGDDEEPEPEEEENEMQEEDEGKGTQDEKDTHNDLDTKNDKAKNKDDKDEHDQNGLDATNEAPEDDKRKQQKQDIDNMKDPELNEDQDNPYHNELEEPPEAEEMDLGDMNNNNDEDNEGDNEDQDKDNPFDIDSMKQNMPDAKDQNEDEEPNEDDQDKEEEKDNDGDESDGDTDVDLPKDGEVEKPSNEDEEENVENEDENEKEDGEPDSQKRGETNEEEEKAENEEAQKEEKSEEHAPSQDKSSKEKDVQSMPHTDDKASADQAPDDQEDKNIKQEQKMDEQETGEEKDGVGQAENEENDDGGHQGVAETKETISREERKNEQKTKEKRKQGRTDEERSLGEAEKNKLKQLKTIEKLKENREEEGKDSEKINDDEEFEAEEYQHVKEPKNSDKTTLDNATEEQSKKIQHQEDENKEENEEDDGTGETNEELMDTDEIENNEDNIENVDEMKAERNEKKSEKPSKSDKTQERTEAQEQIEIEGEIVETMTVPRGDDTTAHYNKELILDTSTQAEDLSATELLEMRKKYQQQLNTNVGNLPQHEHYETWQTISNRMAQNARELCEQLRLILEPTKCTRLKGDYRTGRRINMKKIIPYIASQFRKDKIWLRRTKPAQRDYKITIAIDDSKSMHHNNSKTLTLEAISLVSQALTLLESGRLSVMSFGEAPKIILNHTEQFDGPKLVNALDFSQEKTKIAELLDFIRTVNTEEGSAGADNGLFENLLLVLSDGRNIFSEGKAKVKNAVKLARLQRIFLVYIIIDNPENKNSILDIQAMEMLPGGRINIKSYLDDFPFPYYVIVRDLNQLPMVLSEAMRQWFELVNSEQ